MTAPVAIIKAPPSMNILSAPHLRAALRGAIDKGAKTLILDLDVSTSGEPAESYDSTCLGVMIGVQKHAQERGCTFIIVCSYPPMLKVFDLTGLTGKLDIRESATA